MNVGMYRLLDFLLRHQIDVFGKWHLICISLAPSVPLLFFPSSPLFHVLINLYQWNEQHIQQLSPTMYLFILRSVNVCHRANLAVGLSKPTTIFWDIPVTAWEQFPSWLGSATGKILFNFLLKIRDAVSKLREPTELLRIDHWKTLLLITTVTVAW